MDNKKRTTSKKKNQEEEDSEDSIASPGTCIYHSYIISISLINAIII